MNCVLDLKMKKMNAVTRNAANSISQYNPHLQKWELAEDSVSLFVD